jgi:hypothetical protein
MTEKAKLNNEIGEVYIASTGGTPYASDDVTPETVEAARLNIYGKGISRRLQSLIFPEEYTIIVEDADGNPDPETANIIDKMCTECRLWANMQKAYDDILWHGISVFNDVWDRDPETNAITIKKLRHLPAESFVNAPPGIPETYALRLAGIVLNKAGEVEYWQTNSRGSVIHIKNAIGIIDPSSRFIDGDPVMLPLIPIIDMLKYTWNSQMQQVNRVGAKILFIKVTNPRGPSTQNGNVGDVEYANTILQNWGKDTAFQLRENMELIDLNITDNSNNLEVISALYNTVVDYISPAGFIARQGENGLAGGEKEREKLLSQVISSIHSWLEEQFEQILQRFFIYNQYPPGWKVFISIPSPRVDKTDSNIKKAELLINNRIAPPSRILELLDMEPLTEEEEQELAEYVNNRAPTGAEYIGQNAAIVDRVAAGVEKKLIDNVNKLEQRVMETLAKKYE